MHQPTNILFIKLGLQGSYEKECIEEKNTLKIGYEAIEHNLCINKEWDRVWDQIQDKYKTVDSPTTSHKNQIQKFYEEPDTTMWITFYKNKLWYCYASSNIVLNADGTKERLTLSGWKDCDVNGKQLFIQDLSGRLTKVQGFRGTICDIKEKEYVLHKINATQSNELIAIEKSISELKTNLIKVIINLHFKDFELLIDLIFRASGWSRLGAVGKQIKDIDIELMAPVTNERAIIQVKSESNLATFKDYKNKFLGMSDYNKYFFIVHSPTDDLESYIRSGLEDEIIIYDADKLAGLCINAGLIEWLVTSYA